MDLKINIAISLLSIKQWRSNFSRHPYISIFFIILLCYTLAATAYLFTLQDISNQNNSILTRILPTIIMRILIVVLGLSIVYSILLDNPFTMYHYIIVKLIGTLIILNPLILLLLSMIFWNSGNDHYHIEIVSLLLNSINEVILGGIIIILAEVFSKGYILKQENDLTV